MQDIWTVDLATNTRTQVTFAQGGLYRELDDRLAHLLGVISSSLSLYTAQHRNNWSEGVFFPGRTGEFDSSWDRVGARYFETIGTPVVRGRGIEDEDTAASRKIAVINEAFVRKYFPDEDPIGKHFGKDEAGHAGDYEIVGVAKDAKYQNATRAPRPASSRVAVADQIDGPRNPPSRCCACCSTVRCCAGGTGSNG